MNTKHIDFEKINKIHFIGIGGISMSALAEIVLSKGIKVSGSDRSESAVTKRLVQAGATVAFKQVAENITKDIDLVVYTAAISEDNEELLAAKNAGIETMVRAEFLGILMKEYKEAICVAGTHGKTTTTSMLANVLMAGEKDPTILVGGMLDSIGGNLKIGKSQNFVTEACEYTNSFLSFFPTTAIILNVCADHLDFFKDIDDIRNSFKEFTRLVPKEGLVVINGDIPNVSYFTDDLICKVVKVGTDADANNISAINIETDNRACCGYDLTVDGKVMGRIALNVTGEHNVYNSLAVVAVALNMGLSFEVIKRGIESYTGTERRFEYKGSFRGVNVIDDYAHHPDEIEATLKTAENYPHRELWVVFQPHTYSRTKALFEEFAQTLSKADHLILADIYAARETDDLGVSSELLAKRIEKIGTDVHYIGSFESIEKFLLEKCRKNDLLITMGAGNVVNISDSIVE